jgi:hypothetical protein
MFSDWNDTCIDDCVMYVLASAVHFARLVEDPATLVSNHDRIITVHRGGGELARPKISGTFWLLDG